MKVSIIIPVYRTEHTLARCVNSVLAQTYGNYEVILVDDGSDDGAPALCDAYAQQDARIRVIHQPNAGLSAARNAGVENAKGEYIWFVDSDDFVAADTLAQAVQTLEQAQHDVAFVEFPVMVAYGNAQRQDLLHLTRQRYTDPWQWWFVAEGYAHCYAWNKLFRRSAIGALRFEHKVFEDVFFMLPLLNQVKAFATMNSGLYYYCSNPNGITANEGTHLLDLLEAHVRVLHQLHWARPQSVTQADFARYYAHLLNIQIDVYERCGGKVLLRDLPVGHTPKLLLQRILGVRRTCWLINLIRNICRHNHS